MTHDREQFTGLRRHLPLYAVSVLFLVMVGSLAAIHLYIGREALGAPGPNTVGEAGKVFFAHSFRSGEGLFASGDQAPFYPSFHGALLHAIVGIIGRATGSSTIGLFYIGRGISVICTIVTLGLCGVLLRRWGIGWRWMLPLVLLFFATYRVTQHTYSYRSDNWLLMLSCLSCYLLIARAGRWWSLVFLAVAPVLAFFLKATGVVLLPMIVLALLMQKRRRDAVMCAVVGPVLILVSVVVINAISDGAFLAAMRNAAGVGCSLHVMFMSLNARLMWMPLLTPLFLLHRVSWSQSGPAGERAIVTLFWAIALVWACLTSTRLGAGSYYFVDAFTFGLVLTVSWLAQVVQTELAKEGTTPNVVLQVLVLLVSLQAFFSLFTQIGYMQKRGTPIYDIALTETLKFYRDRQSIVRETRRLSPVRDRYEWLCLSDDAGLNVMLDKPAMVQPLVTSMMIVNGTLDASELVDPIRRHRVAMIVLTGSNWSYNGIKRLPDAAREAILQNYRPVNSDTGYVVLIPNSTPGR